LNQIVACGAGTSQAAANLREKGYHVFHDVLNDAEIQRLRVACREHFKSKGRPVDGGGKKQANAAAEVPAIEWLFAHPRILACFRDALGTDTIMFTSHSDIQKDVLTGWHKDDGTQQSNPNETGYFAKFAYGADDCRVYKMGVYLQDHDKDTAGLTVREGSHHCKAIDDGAIHYTGSRAGSVVLFDVRITHSGQDKTRLQRRLTMASALLPKGSVDAMFAKTRMLYRTLVGRERIASFFTFGLPNDYTIEFSKNNMRRQLRLTPGTSPKLPASMREAFIKENVLLAEDHFADL
jgi:phytanoyl-CoA dioxygenase PhyH